MQKDSLCIPWAPTISIFVQDPDNVKKSFESWWKSSGSKFFAADDDAGEDDFPQQDPEDLEFEELDGAEEQEIQFLEEVEDATALDEEVQLSDESTLMRLEDRSRIQQEVEDFQKEMAEAGDQDGRMVAAEAGSESPGEKHEPERCEDGPPTFAQIFDKLKVLEPFQSENCKSQGINGCLIRMQEMTQPIVEFCTYVRLEDGLLSPSTVLGKLEPSHLGLALQSFVFRGHGES